MAGLNNTLSDTQQTSTTMPAWYDQAQQNIVGQGTAAAAAAPSFGQTTAQGAVNTLQGANNPFTQAQGTLQQISSGAANPWITDPTTGNVTPNTGTAMGGLFAAQQQELNQFMPEYGAGAEAGAIGSGGFGGLRGQTAVEKARGDAFSKLNAAQMQAALTNQQTGSTAAANLGNVGQQGISAGMNVGQAQQNAPFNTVSNYANLLGSLQAPTTTTQQVQLSPLSQAATLANTLQGTGVTGGLGSLLFGSAASGTPGTSGYKAAGSGLFGSGGIGGSALSSLGTGLQNLFKNNGYGTSGVDTGGQGQTTVPIDTSGGNYGDPTSGTGADGGAGAGQVLGTDGNIYNDPTYGTNSGGYTDYTETNPDYNPYDNPI